MARGRDDRGPPCDEWERGPCIRLPKNSKNTVGKDKAKGQILGYREPAGMPELRGVQG